MRFLFFFIVAGFFLGFASVSEAASFGQVLKFTVDPSFDISSREELQTVLVRETSQLSLFVEQDWWNSLNAISQSELQNNLQLLALEFERTIYPNLTSAYGAEWNPGVDGDPKITIVVHRMKKGAGGYFRAVDEHLKLEFPNSNEKEMLYLASDFINTALAKSALAHEFTHLITYNQKERIRKIKEEPWLDEARAEYSPTLLGYNNIFEGSNLEKRLKVFLQNPGNSLVEWQGEEQDYGVASMFAHYLVDHYGAGVLIDSLKSESIGIPSLNAAFLQNGFEVDFRKVFTDWTLAVFLNDCSYGKEYCYLNQNLKSLRLNPVLHLLPLGGTSRLEVSYATKNWAGNWLKFVGGQGALRFEFQVFGALTFKLPYLVQAVDGAYRLDFLNLAATRRGEFFVSDFGTKQKALVIIPTLQTKILGFGEFEPSFPFSLTASILERTPSEEADLIKGLQAQIILLQNEIARVLAELKVRGAGPVSCASFQTNLTLGMRGSEVQCLQVFLKNQGSDVYPEGLATGYFGFLTQTAVARFQEKYATEILIPLGFQKGTGYVGALTRMKMNELLTFSP
ncbi:MAG: peptidoglycan-binding domain-containing protein [Candidatus Wildermuthbacteria bacterium]|nr:peptidoglycan-binding domain-containing protein [Candidatus Wildermuthbacteria bacterium]